MHYTSQDTDSHVQASAGADSKTKEFSRVITGEAGHWQTPSQHLWVREQRLEANYTGGNSCGAEEFCPEYHRYWRLSDTEPASASKAGVNILVFQVEHLQWYKAKIQTWISRVKQPLGQSHAWSMTEFHFGKSVCHQKYCCIPEIN